jgi:Sigma-70, region 4
MKKGPYYIPETVMDVLTDRERHIFKARRISKPPVPLSTLAKELGISRERVRQLEKQAIEKLENPPGHRFRLLRHLWTRKIRGKSTGLSTATQQIVESGRNAWHRIKSSSRMRQNYRDWQAVSDALQIGEDLAQELAGGTDRGGAYSRLVGAWFRENEMSDITSAVRAWCREIRRNQIEIEAWRNSLPAEQRAKLNHPRTVLEHWKRAKSISLSEQLKAWATSGSMVSATELLERLKALYSTSHDASLPSEQQRKASRDFERAIDEWVKHNPEQFAEQYLREHLPPEVADAVLQRLAARPQ